MPSLFNGAIAAFYCLCGHPYFKDLYCVKELDALIAYRQEGGHVRIFDIFCKKAIDFDALLACFDPGVEEISFFFSPDTFLTHAEAVPFTEEGYLMALKPELMPKHSFMVPLLSRC
jgi:hypothetical protein